MPTRPALSSTLSSQQRLRSLAAQGIKSSGLSETSWSQNVYGHLHINLQSENQFFPTRQVSAPLLKHLSPDRASSLQEDFGQKEVALFKATSSNSSFTSFDELISAEDRADLVEKLNNQHASVISSPTSLNRWNLDWNLKVIKGVNVQIMRQRIDQIDWIPK